MPINTHGRGMLKAAFVKGAIPTQQNFADLIDAGLNQRDDEIFKLPGEPLGVVGVGGQRRVLQLYVDYPTPAADWTLSLRPTQDPAQPDKTRPGLGVVDGAGRPRLFIDAATGNLGLGTTEPKAALHVSGGDLLVGGGADRQLTVVSDSGTAGIRVATRDAAQGAKPYIELKKSELSSPKGGVRLTATGSKILQLSAVDGNLDLQISGGISSCGDIKCGAVEAQSLTTSTTLTAGGAVEAKSSLSVAGELTARGKLSALKDLAVSGGLTVKGAADLSGGLAVKGAADLAGGLTVKGAAEVSGDLTAQGGLTGAWLSLAGGNATITSNGTLSAKGGVAVTGGELDVSGKSRLRGRVHANDGERPLQLFIFKERAPSQFDTGFRADTYTALVVGFAIGNNSDEVGTKFTVMSCYPFVTGDTWWIRTKLDIDGYKEHQRWSVWVLRVHNDFICSNIKD